MLVCQVSDLGGGAWYLLMQEGNQDDYDKIVNKHGDWLDLIEHFTQQDPCQRPTMAQAADLLQEYLDGHLQQLRLEAQLSASLFGP